MGKDLLKKRFEAVFQCHFRLTALTSIKLNSYLFNTYPVPGATLSAGQPQTLSPSFPQGAISLV